MPEVFIRFEISGNSINAVTNDVVMSKILKIFWVLLEKKILDKKGKNKLTPYDYVRPCIVILKLQINCSKFLL